MEKYEIQKLRDLPIEEVAERLGMQVSKHKCLCPFHDDHHASFSFNTRKNYCRCYVCMDHSIGTIDLVMKYTGKDFPSACRWLADEHQVYIADRKQLCSSEKAPSFDASKYARFFEHPWLNEAARRFLYEERRIDARVVNWCRLTSWTDKEGISWLQIPYYDVDGNLIGIQNRNLDYKKIQKKLVDSGDSSKSKVAEDSSKSLIAEDSSKSKDFALQDAPRFRFPYGSQCSIYNLPVMRLLSPGEPLYITEGCSDCWAMLSAGHKAIAIPSATLLKPSDMQWLAEMGERFKIEWHMFPDKDAPGEHLYLQLKEILPSLVHHQLPPGCKDFSEYYLKSFCPLPSPRSVTVGSRRVELTCET